MTGRAEHRWLGYETVTRDQFVAVCSCGWRSPPQRTAGLAGSSLDAHREEAGDTRNGNGAVALEAADAPDPDADLDDLAQPVG